MAWEISVAGETFLAEVRQDGEGRFVVSLDGEDIEVDPEEYTWPDDMNTVKKQIILQFRSVTWRGGLCGVGDG